MVELVNYRNDGDDRYSAYCPVNEPCSFFLFFLDQEHVVREKKVTCITHSVLTDFATWWSSKHSRKCGESAHTADSEVIVVADHHESCYS